MKFKKIEKSLYVLILKIKKNQVLHLHMEITYRMKFDRIQIQLFNFVFTKYVDTYPIAMFWNTVSCTRTPN